MQHVVHVAHVHCTCCTVQHVSTMLHGYFRSYLKMKIGLIHQICGGYTGLMQECECTAMTYNLLTNYLSPREILINVKNCRFIKTCKAHN